MFSNKIQDFDIIMDAQLNFPGVGRKFLERKKIAHYTGYYCRHAPSCGSKIFTLLRRIFWFNRSFTFNDFGFDPHIN